MNDWIQLEQVSQYFTTGSLGYKLLMGIFVLIAYRILKRIVNRAILNLATTKGVKKARLSFIQRCFNVALLFLTASIFAIITGIGYGDVSLFLSSIFAVLRCGVYCAVVNSEQHHCQLFDLFCLPIPSG